MLRIFNQTQKANESSENVSEHRFLQPIWDLRLPIVEWTASPLFPVFLTVSTYFITCSIFMVGDMFLSHIRAVQQWRVQPDKKVTWTQVFRAMKMNALNNVCCILPATIAQWIWQPPTHLPILAPTLFDYFYHIWAIIFIFDFQYWVWHAIHHKNRWLYRNFHSLHHQYHSTFSWTTQYLHPWELTTLGVFTTVNGWFFKCHPMTNWSFMVINIVLSVDAHSGYDIPFFPHHWIPFGVFGGGPKHDMHHMRPLTNFQPYFCTWDRLFGWDCPGLRAGGYKSKELLAWEEKNRNARKGRFAIQLMSGSDNGHLELVDDEVKKSE